MVGGGAGDASGSGGAMAGPRRDQVRRSWSCGANGGRWGDHGRPDTKGRGASVHGAIRGSGERPGGVVVGRNRPDEGFVGRGSPEEPMEGPRRRKVAKVVVSEGDWSDERDWKGGTWYDPTQTDARHGGFARHEAAGTDDIDDHGVRACQAVGSNAVGVGDWLGKAGNEVGAAVSRTFPVLQLVCAGGEELQPTQDAGVVLAYFGDILERLVVGVNDELGGAMVTA